MGEQQGAIHRAVMYLASAVLGLVGVYVPLSDAEVAAWLQVVAAGIAVVSLLVAVWKTWPRKPVDVPDIPDVPEIPDVIGLVDMNDSDSKATDA